MLQKNAYFSCTNMAIRVGRWDCPTCGTKMVLGPETRCPNCGASRPKDVRFYLPTDAEIVRDEARLREAKAGVDWICGHCETQNKAGDPLCNSCGNPRDETSQDINLQTRDYGLDEVPTTSFERQDEPMEPPRAIRRNTGRNLGRWLLVGALFLVVSWGLLRAFPQEIQVRVEGFRWERNIQMLHYEPRSYEDWSTPSGAFDVSSFRAIHHYNDVLRGYETRTRTVQVQVGSEQYVCGQQDMGNGYFQDVYCNRPIYENREETYQEPIYDHIPVYATKYRYTIMEWIKHPENLLRSAAQDHDPQWPDQGPYRDSREWKEGERTDVYYITVREEDGDEHVEQLSFANWTALQKGQEIPALRSYLFDMYYGLVKR